MQPNKPVVLVVDDDPVNLDILVQTLEQDYFLIIAKNGKRALDLAFSHHPDLILLDILMPEMDGFEVCQRLKADKETEGIPVIFLSVMESPGQKHRGFEVGGVDYVTKPFHADEVLARVRTHITNKRLREELESHNMLIGMELHEKSRQLETLMNNLPGLAYQGEHSPDRKVRFVSQGVTRLTGYTPEHFMGPDGMGLLALVHPDDRAHVSETLENALRKKEPFELTYRIITSWNEEKWVWEQGAGVHAGGAGEQAPLLVEGFINDVTERLKELGVEVRGFFSTSVGEAMQMIPFEERDHTAILVDVGYLSTEVMAVEGDALIWQKVLPVGGAHITLDLTYGLEKPFDMCEKIKRGYTFNAPKNTQIEVQGENGQMESFSGEQVSMIIDARVDEMLEMIDDAVKKSGIRLGNWSNVYFTGGGLMPMGGARVYAAGKLARNVREAAVKTVKLKPAQIYASGSGLLELVYNTIEQEEQDEGLFDRIKRAFKKR